MFEELLPYLPTALLIVTLSGYLIYLLRNRTSLNSEKKFNEIFFHSVVYGFLSYGLIFLIYIYFQPQRFKDFPLETVVLEISATTFLVSILLIITEKIYEKIDQIVKAIDAWIAQTVLKQLNEKLQSEKIQALFKAGVWLQIFLSLLAVLAIPVLSPFQGSTTVTGYVESGGGKVDFYIQNKADYPRLITNLSIICFDANSKKFDITDNCPFDKNIDTKSLFHYECRDTRIIYCDLNVDIDGYPVIKK